MQTQTIEQIFNNSTINISLVIILLAIGAIVKHCIKNINNDTIPIIILISGIVISILLKIPFKDIQTEILNVLVEGIVSGATAVGLHSQGKTIWWFFNNKDPNNNSSLKDDT